MVLKRTIVAFIRPRTLINWMAATSTSGAEAKKLDQVLFSNRMGVNWTVKDIVAKCVLWGAYGTGGSGRIVPSSPSLQEELLNLVDDTGDRLLAVSKRLVLLWARLADEVQLKEGKGRLSDNTCHALLHAQFQCDRAGGSLDGELKGLYWPGQELTRNEADIVAMKAASFFFFYNKYFQSFTINIFRESFLVP